MRRIKSCDTILDPKDRIRTIDSLINLVEGKPPQKIDMVDMTDTTDMTPEQVRRRYQELSSELSALEKGRF